MNYTQGAIGSPVMTSGLKPSFNAIFKFAGSSLAVMTKHDPFELKDAESEMLAEQTDQVVIEFFPMISSKWGKLATLIVSMIGIFGMKWLSYEKEQAKRIKALKLDNENTDDDQESNV